MRSSTSRTSSSGAADAPPRLRDADRSRAAILASAERLFAERGYDGASLSEIGGASGLSRGAASYFFGSKEKLYSDVLAGVFGGRQDAVTEAFAPVQAWCEGSASLDALREALTRAASAYIRYLRDHRSFVSLIMREELDGGERLREASYSSTAMRDAFAAVRDAGRHRGIGAFRVEDAVLLFTLLTFGAFSYRRTLMPGVGLGIEGDSGRRRQARLAADQVLHLITP